MTERVPLAVRHDVRELSHEVREAQRDLRILNAVRWAPEFEQKFLAQEKKPARDSVTFDYKSLQPRIKLDQKLKTLDVLESKIQKKLKSPLPDAADILAGIVSELRDVSHLISTVGTPEFGRLSRKLWGCPKMKVSASSETIGEIAHRFSKNLTKLSDEENERVFPKILNSEGLASLLRERMQHAHLIESIDVIVTDKIVADAAAGSNYVKIRKDAKFSIKDVDVLLYHEVFTHIVTGLNGRAQPYAKWLGFDSPRCASTQEGLAVFLEMLSGKTYPRRLKRIVDRIVLLDRIQEGESCDLLYDALREKNYTHRESLSLVMRAYRGSDPTCGQPFTKDVSYLKGLIECFNFIQANLAEGRSQYVHALFVGKLSLDEIPAISRLMDRKAIKRAAWIPELLLDVDSLAGWFAYVTALGGVSDRDLQKKYRR